ncbi:amino acid adenylation domain-containing protein [Chitinophaga sp. Hz27]|uniref:amino acid adenylation domain-containing protein n=1 Tax=Chitinophaga sp. Hz27 TaxID=3347169 RepID=UPI0035D92644
MNIRSGKILPVVAADKTAIIYDRNSWSYGDLAIEVWNNAMLLKSAAGRPVAIVSDHPVRRLILALSVIEAGGYCCFLHPGNDKSLRHYMQAWGDVVILTDEKFSHQFDLPQVIAFDKDGYTFPSALFEEENLAPYTDEGGLLLRTTTEDHTAVYVADMPSLREHIDYTITEFGITDHLRLLTHASEQYHDLLEWLLPAITAKATIHFIETFDNNIQEKGAPLLKLTAEGIREWLHHPSRYSGVGKARLIISGHRKVNHHLIKAWRKHFPAVTIASYTYQPFGLPVSVASGHLETAEPLDAGITDSLLLNRPFGKTRIAIHDEQNRPAPLNVRGSLLIQNNLLTRPVLIESQQHPQNNQLLPSGYNARFAAGGKIQLLNQQGREVRKGNQLLMLDETEEIVCTHPLVYKSAAIQYFHNGESFITVAATPKEGESLTPMALRQWLSVYIPAARMPRYFAILPAFPELPDGTADIAALQISDTWYDSQATANETESDIIGIWKEALKLEDIGPADDFFSLGGHSLLGARVAGLINQKMGSSLSLKDIFIYPTPSSLAAFINAETGDAAVERLVRQDRSSYIPLSFSQERVWFIHRMQGSVPFHLSALLKMSGKLDITSLESALRQIVQRHEVIRTLIRENDGEAFQQVMPADAWQLQYADAAALDGEEGVNTLINETQQIPFDLEQDYMLRALLIRKSDQEHLLLFVMHHIATDGGSFPIMMNELVTGYIARTEGREANLPSLPLQYADYTVWQRKHLSGALLERETNYWKRQLEGLSPLELPTDFARPAIQSTAGGMVTATLDKHLCQQLDLVARQEGVTRYVILLAAFKILLARYSGQQDICVGVPVANRNYAELEPLVGFFLNLLALRTNLQEVGKVHDLLQQVRNTLLEAYAHQEVPFEKVVGAQRDLSRSPVFQVLFTLHEGGGAENFRIRDLALSELNLEERSIQFDLDVAVVESHGSLQINFGYCSDLFSRSTATRMVRHFREILQAILENPYRKVAAIPMITSDEATLLRSFNKNKLAFPDNTTFDQLLDDIVERYPQGVAVKHNNNVVTYTELQRDAGKLAGALYSEGRLQQEDIVGVLTDRSPLLVTAIYGIWKAGAVYLPLHPELPVERLKMIAEDAGLKIIITERKYANAIIALQQICSDIQQIIFIDELASTAVAAVPELQRDGHALAYVIYTSGSTGTPKGAMVEHRGLINHQYARLRAFEAGDNCRIAQNASQSFDISIFQMLGALLCGGSTVIYSQDVVLRPDVFLQQVSADGITLMELVPGYLSLVLDELPEDKGAVFTNLQFMMAGGETVKKQLVERWFEAFPHIPIVNGYGPTEASDTITQYIMRQLPAGESISIGKALDNLDIYIVDRNGAWCPPGVIGEIWVAGTGVGRGYVNDPVKTDRVFMQDPFSDTPQRLYKTGDLGRFQEDGTITFIGRKDHQVKIRGYRIELGEIEQRLNNLPEVKEAVVIDREGADKQLALYGYVTLNAGANADESSLKSALGNVLPAYMVPAYVTVLDAFPLNTNGKVDRKLLPMPEAGNAGAVEMVLPRNRTEAVMVSIWQRLLHIQEVSIRADFFELGGHSLLAVRVLSAIRAELSLDISIRDFFTYTTIELLAAHCGNTAGSESIYDGLQKQSRSGLIPLSFSQERLWFIDRLQGSLPYHLSFLLKLTGKVDVKALQYALQQIVNRHEVLRTAIIESEGKGYQEVMPENKWQLEFVDAAAFSGATGLDHFLTQCRQQSFHLATDHALQATLVRESRDSYQLLIVMHHIASDGWSIPLLAHELGAFYNAALQKQSPELPVLPLQYADYAIWQRKAIQASTLGKQLAYWKEKLYGVEPLQLPTDFPRPLTQSNRGAVQYFHIPNELCLALEAWSKANGVTLFTTMLAVFKVLLHRHSTQHDICVGIPVAGRMQPELEQLIGFFVNTIAIRSDFSGNPLFTDFLQQVKLSTLEAYTNQDVPFEMVVDQLTIHRDMSRNPVFQAAFAMNNVPEAANTLQLHGLKVEEAALPREHARFDLSFELFVQEDGLQLTVEYCTDLFTAATAGRLATHYQQLLHAILEGATATVLALPMLSAAETEQLQIGFNTTVASYPQHTTVPAILEQQVQLYAEHIAITAGEQEISYQELDRRANRLAHYLHAKGIGKGALVAVCMARSAELIISITAIVKAGAAYVPIDPAYPDDRIAFILSDTNAALIITDDNCNADTKNWPDLPVLHIRDFPLQGDVFPDTAVRAEIGPESPAYVIYTSGSTGEPKGVIISHRSLLNLCSWHAGAFGVTSVSRATTYAGVGFDASVWEIWPYLLHGAGLYPVPETVKLDVDQLLAFFRTNGITHTFLPTAICEQLPEMTAEEATTMPLILTGGDQLKRFNKELRIINNYGPTEATVVATSIDLSEIPADAPLSIGRPISNTRIYILNDALQLMPIGVAGEIYVGGDGLAIGYHNREALTATKFITDPYNHNERLYATGDLGRWQANGTIEFMGRKDYQVKIRGYRVEPGEIEGVLQQHPFVTQAVVLAREDQAGHKVLVAYVQAETQDKGLLIDYLKSKLPAYMVPAVIVLMEEMPMTPNGKTDRKALPAPDFSHLTTQAYVAAGNEIELALVNIWQELLGVERVGIHDNFFELGGDSIITIQVVSRMKRKGFTLHTKDIFNSQTIASLAALLAERTNTGSLFEAEQGILSGSSPLLPIQQWFLNGNPAVVNHFNQAILLNIHKAVTPVALTQMIASLLAHHDSLRFVYRRQGRKWQQEYGVSPQEIVVVEDMSNATAYQLPALIAAAEAQHQQSLDIENGPLLRMVLMQTPESVSDNRLLIAIHHLVVDGVSWRIILEDIELFLDAAMTGTVANPGPKTGSYRQWYQGLEQYAATNKLAAQRPYWEQVTAAYLPMPVDKSYNGVITGKDIRNVHAILSPELTHQLLQHVSGVYRTDINDLLLAALARVICDHSGHLKVTIGLEGHGREELVGDVDISRTVGWFTSLYPVLLDVTHAGTEKDLIRNTKEQLRSIPDKGLGYGVLKFIREEQGLAGEEPWDIVFNYLGQLDNMVGTSKWLIGMDDSNAAVSNVSPLNPVKEKIAITAMVEGGRLNISWNYSGRHFDAGTVQQLADRYLQVLSGLIQHCLSQWEEGAVYTPSDYGLNAEISNAELDNFFREQQSRNEEEADMDSILNF